MTDPRDPPVPVVAWLALDSQERAALVLGWAENPTVRTTDGAGWFVQNASTPPGFDAEFLGWVRAEHISRADG